MTTTAWEEGVFAKLFKDEVPANSLFDDKTLNLSDEVDSFTSDDLFSSEDDVPQKTNANHPFPVPIFSLGLDEGTALVQPSQPAQLIRPLARGDQLAQSDDSDASPERNSSRKRAHAGATSTTGSERSRQRRPPTARNDAPDDEPYEPLTSSSRSTSTSTSPSPPPAPKRRRGRRAAKEILEAEGIVPNDKPENVDPAIAAVALSRERLLTITSDEMEERFARLHAQRNLTQPEMKELRRQRRLVKNREYAQQSRNKKKMAQENVHGTISSLRRDNAALRARLEAATAAASSLGGAGAAVLAALLGNADAAPPTSAAKRRRVDTASSAVLFVLLFSFGVFLNSGVFSAPGLTPAVVDAPAQPLRGGVAPTTPVATARPGPLYTGRALLCNDEWEPLVAGGLPPLLDSNATDDALPPLLDINVRMAALHIASQ